MQAEPDSYPQSAAHEVVQWPWQRRDSYGTFAAVMFVHLLLIIVAFRVLAPHLEEYRKLDAVIETATDPAVNWVDNSATPDSASAPAPERLPYARGDSPENDPPSRIALPIRPAAVPRTDPAPPPETTSPPPEPAPKIAPVPVTPPPAPAKPVLPRLSAAPAPAPPAPVAVPEPAPKIVPEPKPKPVEKPAARLALAPAPAPALKPAPTKPPVKPAPAPVVLLKPEVVAPPAALPSPVPAPPSPTLSPPGGPPAGSPARPGHPSGTGQAGDLSSYHRLIHDAFHSHWRQPKSLPSGSASYQTKVKITIARDGTIVNTAIVKPSGNPVMESSVWRAVQSVRRIAPLPVHIESANYSVVINFQLD